MMNKKQFLGELRKQLNGLPEKEAEGMIDFYSEMIDDRIGDGRTEEDAVRMTGSPTEIAASLISEYPFAKVIKERARPKRRLAAWEKALLILGSPLWLSLIALAVCVILALLICVFALWLTLWIAVIAVLSGFAGAFFVAVVFFFRGFFPTGLLMLGSAFICAGLGIFLFVAAKAVSARLKSALKKAVLKLKTRLIKGGAKK